MSILKEYIDIYKKIIIDCSFENGAIVAANPAKEYYPREAKNYFYVWPRDASYACIAADLLGLAGFQEGFFRWCLKRAEGFCETGLFFEKYYANGLKASARFQPDQTGSVLFAIEHHYQDDPEGALEFEDLINKAADGLARAWNGKSFDLVATDLWEERLAFPDLEENFTYSLAACIRGLECACEMIPEGDGSESWRAVAEEIRSRLDEHFVDGHFVRSFGKLADRRIDASVLGLVYPFAIYKAEDPRIVSTVEEIERRLVVPDDPLKGGVHRYEQDEYDGWMYEGMHRRKGGGAWPLLNFWLSIYWALRGDSERARGYYDWVLDRTDGYIPEQIFDNDLQVSVSPLLWSHAIFVIASRFLGYL
ncbi:MAG: glycoside hydrolase family 15 protein [Candidatus Altiarchaeota archaeon]|nr:glycoside hydrolase family 15 protein [Candidatus Altiarchaeota archaeon]